MNAEPPPDFWRGEKVRLRAVEQKDLEALAVQEPDTDLERFEDTIYFPVSKQQNRENWECLSRKRDDDTFFWVIENAEGTRVGNIGTFDCDWRVGAFKYGVVTLRPFWRRGYAREAISIVLRYYLHELRYQITAIVYAFNGRAQQLHGGLRGSRVVCGGWSIRMVSFTTNSISAWPEKNLTTTRPRSSFSFPTFFLTFVYPRGPNL